MPREGEHELALRLRVALLAKEILTERFGTTAQLAPNTSAGEGVYTAIEKLVPRDQKQSDLKAQAATTAADLGQVRMLLLAQTVPSIPKPLLIAVSCWLVIIFLCFSLLAPPNATTILALTAAAISVAGAVFLIMEFDQPFAGTIRISSEPMLNVLNHLGK